MKTSEHKMVTQQENPYSEERIEKLTEKVAKQLDEKRMKHTLSVAHTASCMAMRFGEDPYKAYVAGLLHDCAKGLKNKKKLELAGEYGIEINDAEKDNPDLLHAKLGSILAKEEYGIEDEDIISAIRYHTTGKPDMTPFEMIIYIADFIEIHRKPLMIHDKARKAAFTDLEEAMRVILEGTLAYLGKKGAMVDPITQETYRYYNEK